MLISYSCILKMINMKRIVIGESKAILLILFIVSKGSNYTRKKNRNRRYGYSRGRDLLRFKVTENADRRQTWSSMLNKGVRRYRKKITRYRS